jgi:hypothetical protein
VPGRGRARSNPKRERDGSITIVTPKQDRGQQIVEDPDAYFREARRRATEQVERDLERERLAEA